MSCQKTSKQVFQMRKERKNIFRALFRDPFQPFLQNDGNDRSYSYIVQKRGSNRMIKIAKDLKSALQAESRGCRSLTQYVASIWEASKETMKQIFWKSSIGNGNIVHYTFYQHFENPMLIRNRDLGTIKDVDRVHSDLRSVRGEPFEYP